jgi:HK97 gp10 family phage protein
MVAGNVELLGIGDLKKSFEGLAKEMVQKTSLRMVASAGAVLRREAKALALSQGLKKSGALLRNIAIKRERKAPPGVAQYNLGVRHGRHLGNGKRIIKYLAVGKSGRVVIRRQNDPFYWRFHEFGTKKHSAKPFIEQSLENKRAEALSAMEARLKKDLERSGR